MFNICLFCKFPFTKIDIATQHEVEGKMIAELKCHNCGAEYENSTIIKRGPTKQFAMNEISKNKEQK
jgi:hypothetical protein